jgi:hypothetical protein
VIERERKGRRRARGNEGFLRELSYPVPTLLAFLLSLYFLFLYFFSFYYHEFTILRCGRNTVQPWFYHEITGLTTLPWSNVFMLACTHPSEFRLTFGSYFLLDFYSTERTPSPFTYFLSTGIHEYNNQINYIINNIIKF